jgi:hypothetical protein
MGILNYSAALNQAPDSVGRTLGAAGQMQGLQAQRQNMTFQQQNQEEGQAQRLAQQQQQAQAQQQEQAARQQGAELLQTGTPQEIARFMILNKDVAKDFINAANFQDTAAEESRVDFAKEIVSDQVDPEQAYIERIATVEANGGDASGLRKTLESGADAMRSTAEKDLSMLASKSMINYKEAMGIDQDNGIAKFPSSVRESMWFNKQSQAVQDVHMKLKRDEKPTLDERLVYEEGKEEMKVDAELDKATRKTQAQRLQGYVDTGVSSADNLIVINQSLALLNSVATGGIDKALLSAKRLLGIESADEAELSYNLGKTVLAQLKPTFGGAFTKDEVKMLINMESNLGKSIEGNKRILRTIQKTSARATKRALRAAEKLDNEFAADEIRNAIALSEKSGSIFNEAPEQQQAAPKTVNWSDL